MKTLVINDIHAGVKRQGGTTHASREALEGWMLDKFSNLVRLTEYDVLIILGDLFDSRNVDEYLMAKVIDILLTVPRCYVVLGNHDLGGVMDEKKMSSAEFVGMVSGHSVVKEPLTLGKLHIIPHLFNQEAFDKAVDECPENKLLLVHCNIDSNFAHGDHSLNLSREQIETLDQKHVEVIAGHEHKGRVDGNVTVIGNQFPSSISDCIGESGKRALLITDDSFSTIPTWDGTDYTEIHVTAESPTDAKFIRVMGECSIQENAIVVSNIAKFRASSNAFIIKNDVKVLTQEVDIGSIANSVDSFNIVDMFMEEIPEAYKKEVEECI